MGEDSLPSERPGEALDRVRIRSATAWRGSEAECVGDEVDRSDSQAIRVAAGFRGQLQALATRVTAHRAGASVVSVRMDLSKPRQPWFSPRPASPECARFALRGDGDQVRPLVAQLSRRSAGSACKTRLCRIATPSAAAPRPNGIARHHNPRGIGPSAVFPVPRELGAQIAQW
jgi:hypothetical protein